MTVRQTSTPAGLYDQDWGTKNTRPIPREYKDRVEAWLKPGWTERVLELGSNQGLMLDFLALYSSKVIGSDLNYGALLQARHANTFALDATHLALTDGCIDKSLSLHTLEHIPDLHLVFQELDRVTKPGGLTFHAFPAAAIRGLDGALLSGFRQTANPWKAFMIARQLHVHNLNPDRLRPFIAGTNWRIVRAEKVFVPAEFGPAWMVLLEKRTG